MATNTAHAAVTTWVCLVSFICLRMPWTVISVGHTTGGLGHKDALALASLIGYAVGKGVTAPLVGSLPRARRLHALLACAVAAQLCNLLFAVGSRWLQLVCIALNGLVLAATFCILYSYIEGRMRSEVLAAALSTAAISGGGAARWLGSALLSAGVGQDAMPAVAGALALLPLLPAALLLDRLPEPSAEEVSHRVARTPMSRAESAQFMRRYAPGLYAMGAAYLTLTVLMTVRSFYVSDIYEELYPGEEVGELYVETELVTSLLVCGCVAALSLVPDSRTNLRVQFALMLSGSVAVLFSWLFFDQLPTGGIDRAAAWFTLCGLGLWLGYIPISTCFFDRLFAVLASGDGSSGNAVSLIAASDAVAYAGTVAVMLVARSGGGDAGHLKLCSFYLTACRFTSVTCLLCMPAACLYFDRKSAPASVGVGKRRAAVPCGAPLAIITKDMRSSADPALGAVAPAKA